MPFELPCIKHHVHVQVRTFAEEPRPKVDIICVHGREQGIALEDVDDAQLLLFSMLDGKHTFATIVTHLQEKYPEVAEEDITEILNDLTNLGLVEDAAIMLPPALSATDLTRYASQIRCFSILDRTGTQKYEAQARLKQVRITVLGLGGLGSNVLIGLSAMGIGFIRGVDFDTIELGNLNRQVLYNPAQIGQSKVMAAMDQVKKFNPDICFEPVHCRIESSQDIVELIRGTDLAVLSADQPTQIMNWMNHAAFETNIPFISGGYHGVMAEVGPFVVPFETSCLECAALVAQALPQNLPDDLSWLDYNAWIQHPNAHFVTATVANLVCSEICMYTTKLASPNTYNQIFGLDLRSFTSRTLPRPRQPHCPVCGEKSGTAHNSTFNL